MAGDPGRGAWIAHDVTFWEDITKTPAFRASSRNATMRHGFSLKRSPEIAMNKNTDDKLDPKAKGVKTPQSDFDRNRDGLYGGLPKARDTSAPGPAANQPHPSR